MTQRAKTTVRKFQCCYFVYILASLRGALYVGLTDDLKTRMIQHRSGTFDGFTKKYKIDRLMYFETYSDWKTAEHREIQVKKYRPEKKIALFKESNPQWKDVYREILQAIGIPRSARDFRKKTEVERELNHNLES